MASQKWVCTSCGHRHTTSGARPAPGQCPKRPKDKDGRWKPHTWVKDKA